LSENCGNKTNPCNAEFKATEDQFESIRWYFEALDTSEENYTGIGTGRNYNKEFYKYIFSSGKLHGRSYCKPI